MKPRGVLEDREPADSGRPDTRATLDSLTPLVVDSEGACALLGGISRDQLGRIVDSGRLPVVRLPGGRDRYGRGTPAPTRRVFYSIEDLQRLIRESTERSG